MEECIHELNRREVRDMTKQMTILSFLPHSPYYHIRERTGEQSKETSKVQI